MAPRVCAECHTKPANPEERGYFPPMMNFPDEPEESRIEIDDRYRCVGIVKTFHEGWHCGSNVFGPYGAIWLSKLRADAQAGELAPSDRPHLERLHEKYARLLSN
jgi:hypothetical protein